MLYKPHFMHPLFSFSLYSPMNTIAQIEKINEYKAHRSRKKHKKESVSQAKT
jgi:hypothetical protein